MSNIRVLEIPKWGLSMEEGTVLQWLIAEGEDFAEGQEICEIESSKIVNVLEAPFAGTLRRILAPVDATLPVQAPIAVAAPSSVTEREIDQFIAKMGNLATTESGTISSPAPTPGATTQTQDRSTQARVSPVTSTPFDDNHQDVDIPQELSGSFDKSEVHSTPRARERAAEWGVDLRRVKGSGRSGRISIADIRRAVAAAGGSVPPFPVLIPAQAGVAASRADDRSVAATPLARKLAQRWNINLLDCRGSGRHRRVTRADVEAAHRRAGGAVAQADKSHLETGRPFPDTTEAFADRPLSGMRKTIAARLQQSKQEAPHYRLTIDCRINGLLQLRRQINQENPAVRLSVNDFLVKAAGLALIEVPECNIQFNGTAIRQFEHAHVAIAVALESGLITPIIRCADRKGLLEISAEASGLVTRAKANTLKSADFSGGTLTVSNLGMFGVRQFDAIINPPQAAILAVGVAEPRVVVDEDKPAVATVLTVTLSSDHRVIDGALGARLLAAFRSYVEQPARMLA